MESSKPKILILQQATFPDYMADMVSHYLYSVDTNKYSLFSNQHPLYLFRDFPDSIPLYGRGFTIYRKLNHELKHNILLENSNNIITNIKERKYDKIIWTSIRRYNLYLGLAIQSGYEQENLIAIDGEDDQIILRELKENKMLTCTKYYKRELTQKDMDIGARPISFKFPQTHDLVGKNTILKSQILAPCDPRYKSSYIYKEEFTYYENYQRSLFGFTTKKNGWDCLRHYEILACNCLPIFPDIEKMPSSTMIEWDRPLQQKVNSLWREYSLTNQSDINYLMPFWKSLMEEFKTIFVHEMVTDAYSKIIGL